MQRQLMIGLGAIFVFVGAVFSLQGFGVLKGSPMSDTTTWSIAGPAIVIAGAALIATGMRRGR